MDAVGLYLDRVGSRLRERFEESCRAVYVGGSYAEGDFQPGRSDLDVLVLLECELDERQRDWFVQHLRYEVLPCPAKGLDLLVVREGVAAEPPREPRYELGMASGAEWPLEVVPPGHDPEVLLELAVFREQGVALFGAAAREIIGEVPREWLRDETLRAVRWHRDHVHHPLHDPAGHFAVMNAARAWLYCEEGRLVSKTRGTQWARSRAEAKDLLGEALRLRRGVRRQPLKRDEVVRFVDDVLERLS